MTSSWAYKTSIRLRFVMHRNPYQIGTNAFNWCQSFWANIESTSLQPWSNRHWHLVTGLNQYTGSIHNVILTPSFRQIGIWTSFDVTCVWCGIYPKGPEADSEAGWGSEFVPLEKKVKLAVLPHSTKFHEPHVVLEYAHFSNNIIAMKSLPSGTDHQCLAQYREIWFWFWFDNRQSS